MRIAPAFTIEYTKRKNAKLQVVYVRGCRIVKHWDGYKTLQDWCEQILMWRPFKGTCP